VINKHNLRINVLAAAVLSLTTGAGMAQAADLKVSAPQQVPAAQQQATNGIIVKYKAGTSAASTSAAKVAVVNGALSRATLSGNRSTASARAAAFSPQVVRRLGVGADLIRLKTRLGSADLDKVLAELRADPAVQYAVPDARMYAIDAGTPARARAVVQADATPALVPNDPYYAQYQWHLHSATGGVNAPAAWDVAQGEGVVVAVLDTGILPQHPDFASGALLPGYDFISDAETSRRPTDERVPGALDMGDWVENNNECYDGSLADDSSWHGTHVAGTIAEATNNALGMAGVAHKASVLPVRVLGKCGGYLSDIADAITWASGGTVAGVPANTTPADIINMSLGGGSACDPLYQDAINGAVSRGTLVVVAAGNSASNAANFRPASCSNVIAVGASRITGGIASYSNFGTVVDLSGPGGGGGVDGNPGGYVWQAGYNGTTTPTSGAYSYMGMAGTSMASPHVAGIVALMQSAAVAAGKDALTPAKVRELLVESVRPFPVQPPANRSIGAGLADAGRAVQLALGNTLPEPPVPELQSGVLLQGLGGGEAQSLLYRVEVPAGTRSLNLRSLGGRGDVSLYAAPGAPPSVEDAAYRSRRAGTAEAIVVASPQPGTWYLRVVGEATFNGVSVLALAR